MAAPEKVPEQGPDAGPDKLGAVVADVRSHLGLVLVVVVVAVVASLAATVLAPTTYTGRSSLIVSSNNRSPDQDAVLVQGYVDFFDDESYQQQILDEAGVGASVTLEARAAAASPILVITATADDAETAQAASAASAEAFAAEINEVRVAAREAKVAELQNRLRLRTRTDGGQSASVAALRQELITVESDRTDMLQELQLTGGVATDAPSLVRNVGLGLVGGLVLGLVAAVALGGLRRRGGAPA